MKIAASKLLAVDLPRNEAVIALKEFPDGFEVNQRTLLRLCSHWKVYRWRTVSWYSRKERWAWSDYKDIEGINWRRWGSCFLSDRRFAKWNRGLYLIRSRYHHSRYHPQEWWDQQSDFDTWFEANQRRDAKAEVARKNDRERALASLFLECAK